MAWPFSSVGPPNLDIGPGVAIPLVPTVITASQAWLTGADMINDGASFVIVTVTNSAGAVLAKVSIPPGGTQPYEWPFKPALGVKWSADVAGVIGHVWGYV